MKLIRAALKPHINIQKFRRGFSASFDNDKALVIDGPRTKLGNFRDFSTVAHNTTATAKSIVHGKISVSTAASKSIFTA